MIRYYPSRTLTLPILEAAIESSEIRPDLVIVDYASLLRPPTKRDERRYELVEIFESLRGVAGRVGIPVWTAHQANRTGVSVRLLGMEHQSECFEIGGVIDLGISVNRDVSKPAECVLYVWKNRLGKSEVEIPCAANWETSMIRCVADDVE